MLLATLLLPTAAAAKEYVYTDAAVKAAYILNTVQFIDAPRNSGTQELCIIGDDLIGISVANQQMANPQFEKNIKISKREANSSFNTCDVLYISANLSDKLDVILFKTEHLSVLTMSDIERFAQRGGMIELVTTQNKVQMHINSTVTKEHNITLSSKLLSYAKRVYR